eukprot:11755640-Karenia_brevis.AAC.1
MAYHMWEPPLLTEDSIMRAHNAKFARNRGGDTHGNVSAVAGKTVGSGGDTHGNVSAVAGKIVNIE